MGWAGIMGFGLLSTYPVRFTYLIKLVLETLEQVRLRRRGGSQCQPTNPNRLKPTASASGLESNLPKTPASLKVLT